MEDRVGLTMPLSFQSFRPKWGNRSSRPIHATRPSSALRLIEEMERRGRGGGSDESGGHNGCLSDSRLISLPPSSSEACESTRQLDRCTFQQNLTVRSLPQTMTIKPSLGLWCGQCLAALAVRCGARAAEWHRSVDRPPKPHNADSGRAPQPTPPARYQSKRQRSATVTGP